MCVINFALSHHKEVFVKVVKNLLLGSEEGTDSFSGSTSESWVHLADSVSDFEDGQSLASVFTPAGFSFTGFQSDSVGASLDGDSVVVSDSRVFEGVLVFQVTWVFAELDSAGFSGFDQVGVVLSDDAPNNLLRHFFVLFSVDFCKFDLRL